MNFDSVLIITYGRSGSTLLQGLLNAMPGCVVRGENYNVCHGLYQAWSAMARTRAEFASSESSRPEHPWFGANTFDPGALIEGFKPLVRSQLLGGLDSTPQCLGFKEIRYLSGTLGVTNEQYAGRLHDYLRFLARLFPRPAFVFLTRDHDQVANSAWWKGMDPPRVKAALAAFETHALSWRHEGVGTFHIDYADVVAQNERVAALFEFMGAPFDAAVVASVLSREHSFGNNRSGSAGSKDTEASAGGRDRGQMVGEATTRKPAPRKPSASNLPHPSGLQPEVLNMPTQVLRMMPDPLPDKPVAADARLRWNGVVVVRSPAPGVSLQLRLPDGQTAPVAWGIDSPKMLAELPSEPLAAKARYKTPEFTLGHGQQCALELVGPEGAATLWRLRRPEPQSA